MARFAQLAFLPLLPFLLFATFVPEARAMGRFHRKAAAVAPAAIPPDTLWVPRDRAQKGLVLGGVAGAMLGSFVARAVIEDRETPQQLDQPMASALTLVRDDAPSGVFKGVALAMVTTAVGAFLGKAIGAGATRWEATVPGSTLAAAGSTDEGLRALRAATRRGADLRRKDPSPVPSEPGTSLAAATR